MYKLIAVHISMTRKKWQYGRKKLMPVAFSPMFCPIPITGLAMFTNKLDLDIIKQKVCLF